MITNINHIGIAVNSIEEHIPFYRDVLGLEFLGIEEVPEQKVNTAIFKVGDAEIELLEPTSPESTIAKFIESKGEGMHHISYQTDNIETEIAKMKNHEVRMIDEAPRGGVQHTRIAFLHPKSSGRVLTELTEAAD
ncbi:MAG: methylmalonyl-CoA epimerase [Spirochaetales bacterium]|nr:methylmalonyl-CoA epimerase [Spirochaetales bacterium]